MKFLIICILTLVACRPVPGADRSDASVPGPVPSMHFGALAPGATSFGQLSAASGTLTVPTGWYATGIAAHSSAAATVVITPWGPNAVDAGLGPSIAVPTTGLGIGFPMIQGTELGAGTTVTGTGTDSLVITLHPTVN